MPIGGNVFTRFRQPAWLPRWSRYLLTILLVLLITAALVAVQRQYPAANFGIPYILLAAGIAYVFGLGPAILGLLLSLAAYIYLIFGTQIPLWPPSIYPLGWGMLITFFVGTHLIAFLALLVRHGKERVQLLEAEQRSQRQRLQTILDTLPVAVAITDASGRVIDMNDHVARVWGGLPPAPRNIEDYKHFRGFDTSTGRPLQPGDWPLARALRNKTTVIDEIYDIMRFDGTSGTIIASAVPLKANGEVTGAVGVMQDITTQRELERKAQEQASTLSAVFEQVPVGLVMLDTHLRYLHVNSVAVSTVGGRADELIGERFEDCLEEQFDYRAVPEIMDIFWEVLNTGEPYSEKEWQLPLQEPRDAPIYLDWQVSRVHDTNGIPLGLLLSMVDVTDKVESRNAIRESEERLQAIIDNTPAIIYLKDTNYRFVLVNRQFEELFGLTRDVALGQTDYDFLSKEHADVIRQNDIAVMESGVPLKVEETVPINGEMRTYISVKIPLRDAEGRIYALCGVSTDITEQKRIQAELAQALRAAEEAANSESQARATMETILDTVPVGVITVEAESGQISYSSSAVEEILGRQIAGSVEYPDSASLQLFTEDGLPLPLEQSPFVRSLRYGERVTNAEVITYRADGSDVALLVDSAPVVDSCGRITATVASLSDISELTNLRKTLQSQMLLLQRALAPKKPTIGDGYDVDSAYLPSVVTQEVGGDFYDVFQTADGHFGVLIGDVSGKGLQSAALAAATRSTVRSFAYELADAGEALSHANAVLFPQQPEYGNFVSIFLAILDADTGNIDYASAGHPPAAIYRSVSSDVEFAVRGEAPVGVLENIKYNNHSVHLDQGDKIVLYTDGITEARRDNELFELEGLERALLENGHLPCSQLVNAIVDSARSWAEGRFTDDAAVIVVERLK